ncbi:MAG: radical SAM protein [Candidatus Marinimicrobia bacterium]|nr:radical SAM protein [Candidatus Neomarinimicrobiota bacterium]
MIQTPVEDFYSTVQRTYPLGLTYLAAGLKELPVDMEIIDFLTAHGRQTIPVPDAFLPIISYLPYDRSPIAAFHTYYHIGTSWDSIRNYFENHFYDICAISSNFYTYSEEVLTTAEIIKSVSPQTIIIVGGQNVGPYHSLFTDSPDIDYCLQGEAEISFCRLIECLLDKNECIENIAGLWNASSKIWNSPEIQKDFTFSPDISALPADTYRIAGKPAIMISTSRGCPMGCRFCSVSQTFGSRLRLKSVNRVLKEMQTAYDRGIQVFDLEDDNFTFDRPHCINLLNGIINQFKGKVDCYAMNGLSTEHLDEEIIDLLIKANFKLLNLSIATVSATHLKELHRFMNINTFTRVARYAGEQKLKTIGHFIAGLPGQSPEDILHTMRVLAKLPLVLGISPFYYIPGIDIEVPNIPPSCKEARLTRFWPADYLLSKRDLITLFRLSRWINYVKEQLKERHLDSIAFTNIARVFSDDTFINSLIKHKELIGIDSEHHFYPHTISQSILECFFTSFKDTFIHCG